MRPVHEGIISCHYAQVNVLIALSDDTFVSASRDGTLKLWDIRTAMCIKTFIGHSGPVYGIAKINDGRFISCAGDQMEKPTARLWDLDSGVCLRKYIGHTEAVTSVIKMSDSIFVTVSSDVTANVWNLQKGRHMHSFQGSSADGFISAARVNDEIFVATNEKSVLFVWNIHTFHHLHTISAVALQARPIIHRYNNHTFLASSGGGELKQWNVNTGNCVGTFNIAANTAQIAWLNGNFFLCASETHNILELFNVRTGVSVLTLRVDHPVSSVTRINEVTFLVGHHNGTARLWKVPGDCLTERAA